MYVKVSQNEDGTHVADHTFAEISEHVNNGGTASVVYNNNNININLPIIGAEENALVFSSFLADDQLSFFTVVIVSDNTIFLDNFFLDEHFVPVDVGPDFAGKFLIVGEDGTVGFRDLILPSSTEGSTKKFKITVDDNSTLKVANTSDSSEVTIAKTSDIPTDDHINELINAAMQGIASALAAI